VIEEKKFVQIGAGNIGRSFIGQLFARAGFEVVFVDIDDALVRELNRRRRYRVEIKDVHPEVLWVENVRAVHGADVDACARELATCRLCATAVGAKAVPYIMPMLAAGLEERLRLGNPPLDVIIAENLRNAAQIYLEGVRKHLPADFPIHDMLGLVETSIGKMVPIMPEEVRRQDMLVVYAEAYNTLICDARGFRNPIPQVPGLDPKENMAAYVDRKLFVHNLGHACCAYFGHFEAPDMKYVWQAVEHPLVGEVARRAMWESGKALINAYPQEFDEANMGEHVEDLLRRFGNKALGDTIYRVGRDVPRKLGRDERLIGALLFDLSHSVSHPIITAHAAAAAMYFRATDEHGELFPADLEFAEKVLPRGLEYVLSTVCNLSTTDGLDLLARQMIASAHQRLSQCRAEERPFLRSLLD
jgi:mannitol-1-phosphate 5-dehydrogenase